MTGVPSFRPFKPMSPIAADRLPEGTGWTFQLKWDGYRLVAAVQGGRAQLYSKNMLPVNAKYPELAEACGRLKGSLLLDGEAVVMDPATGRPNFQKMQQRSKPPSVPGALAARWPVQYIVFDVLEIDGENLRRLPFEERDRRLRELAKDWEPPLYTTDCFTDGNLLWRWVQENGWEGVVGKRLASAYREGKEHRDWVKRKRKPEFDVEIVGILWREGRVASLVMRENGAYFGRVSAGLDGKLKEKLRPLGQANLAAAGLPLVPAEVKREDVRWLKEPIGARVTGTEVTDEGVLRHPKLLSLDL